MALALAVLKQRCRPGRAFTSSSDVEAYLRLKLAGRRNEVFGIVCLTSQNRLIGIAELFKGTIDGATVYPRVVVQKALENNAAAVVLFHTHPSGVADASHADRVITEKLQHALELFDIRLLDHFIVTDARVASFAEQGWL
ncbi:MAG: DNA repair protein RadC [Acidobacteria bacterium]|nr:DNA repair protein RadC [Acidobacteriota bacterium]